MTASHESLARKMQSFSYPSKGFFESEGKNSSREVSPAKASTKAGSARKGETDQGDETEREIAAEDWKRSEGKEESGSKAQAKEKEEEDWTALVLEDLDPCGGQSSPSTSDIQILNYIAKILFMIICQR